MTDIIKLTALARPAARHSLGCYAAKYSWPISAQPPEHSLAALETIRERSVQPESHAMRCDRGVRVSLDVVSDKGIDALSLLCRRGNEALAVAGR